MNRVGKGGSGESVWLAFFRYDVFTRCARVQQDPAFAERGLAQVQLLQHNIEQHSWDGQWYRRACYDDGATLGLKLLIHSARGRRPPQFSSFAKGVSPKFRRG